MDHPRIQALRFEHVSFAFCTVGNLLFFRFGFSEARCLWWGHGDALLGYNVTP